MPIHEYRCRDCGKEYEVFYKSQSERDLEEKEQPCPQCESTNKDKLVSTGTSFELKGNNWFNKGGY